MDLYSPDYQLVIINVMIMGVMLLKYRRVIVQRSIEIDCNYFFVAFGLLLYSVFAFAESDTYGYYSLFDTMRRYHEKIHVEEFYFWLTQFIDNYFVWRLIIWGLATFILIFILRFFHIDSFTAGFLIPSLLYYQFAQTRASLGLLVLLVALIILIKDIKKIKNWFFSLLFFCIAFQLHKSISVFMVLIPIAFIIPLTKKTIVITLLIFPLLYGIISSLPDYLLSWSYFQDDTINMGNMYLEKENYTANFNGMLRLFLDWSGVLLNLALTTLYFCKFGNTIDQTIVFMQKYGYLLVYVSFLFYGQLMSSFISSRTLHAAAFPLLITSCYYYQNKDRNIISQIALILLSGFTFVFNTIYYYFHWQN